MRLTSTHSCDAGRAQRCQISWSHITIEGRGQNIVGGKRDIPVCRRGPPRMNMRRYLCNRERMSLLTAFLSKRVTRAYVDRHPPAQIGQTKIHSPVTAEC